jgi:hypothetical protein
MKPDLKPVERASNFEFWLGRGRSSRTSRFRRWWLRVPKLHLASMRMPSMRLPVVRWRPLAAGALIAGLAAAWLIAGRHSPPAVDAVAQAPMTAASTTVTAPRTTTSTTVPVSRDCGALSGAQPVVRCVIGAVDVDVRLLSSARVGAAYRRASGADVAARTGSPACAHGAPDERAGSAATAPIRAIGRYRCRFEHGLAAMWWTNGDRLVHAVARDADLAGLFSWWRSHPLE